MAIESLMWEIALPYIPGECIGGWRHVGLRKDKKGRKITVNGGIKCQYTDEAIFSIQMSANFRKVIWGCLLGDREIIIRQ